MVIHTVAQGTTAWLQLRCGLPTASRFDEIITAGGKKGEPGRSTSWTKYMNHLLGERILGTPIEGFKSQWMERGNDFEHRAVASYELSNECDTEQVGFVTTDDGRIGCSPDRLIVGQPKRGLEAKAPSAAVHVSYLLHAAGASAEYKVQLQGQIWICEWDSVDIVSYYPGMPDALFRAERDDKFIEQMHRLVYEFSDELEARTEDFKARGWIKPKEENASEPEGGDWLGVSQSDVEAIMAMQRRNKAAEALGV